MSFRTVRTIVVLGALTLLGAQGAMSRVGESYVQIPGLSGGARGVYKGALRIESRYWSNKTQGGIMGAPSRAIFSGPSAPRNGSGKLFLSFDKTSPGYARMMKLCAENKPVPELTYVESAKDYRPTGEIGPRPADVPEYFHYKLKDVTIQCPVADGAPEQVLIMAFKQIELLNYDIAGEITGTGFGNVSKGKKVTLTPASLPPLSQATGKVKSYVVSWIAPASDVADDQCASMMKGPPQEALFTYKTKEEADRIRASFPANADANGVAGATAGDMQFRGPGGVNACLLPGVVPDPGAFVEPTSKFARGLNLDGDDGTGKPKGRTCKHRNFSAADGRTGIDNQFYRVTGCIADFQGHKGGLMQAYNSARDKDGPQLLIQISGIDDEKNDDSVDVTLLFTADPRPRSVAGDKFLPGYTYRLIDSPEWTMQWKRLRGRIVNGVIETETVPSVDFNNLNIGMDIKVEEARFRFEFKPDGSMKALLGGYMDWRYFMYFFGFGGYELSYGFQCPALYSEFRREADGLKDPVTGECNGISIAYDIDAVPAFLTPSQQKMLMASTAPALEMTKK